MTGDEAVPLSQHDILSAAECHDIRARVFALRERWTERSPNSFYTLGAASYLDAPSQHAAYQAAAQVTNPILRENFPELYELTGEFFAELVGEAVYFDEAYALPGFHVHMIHGCGPGGDNPAPRAHFDLQWKHALADCTPQATLSFTLLIEGPSGGASMAVWPVRYQEALQLGFTAREYAARYPPQEVAYTPGRIVVHDGFVLHAIGSAPPSSRGFRVTFQGHGVRLPRGWMLYW
jgi:hypothetical protein